MYKILIGCAVAIGLIVPAISAVGLYIYQAYEFFGIPILGMGFVLGIATYHYFTILNAKKMEQHYKDSLIKQSQAQDELAVLFQKELDKHGLSDIEVIINDNGAISIKNEKEIYVEDGLLNQLYSDALRILNSRMLRR